MSFWQKLPAPFFVLAPMADVTDAPFRRLIAKYGAHMRPDGTMGGPDVTWTEFVSADGLIRATPEGKKKLLADLIYTDAERPIVAQLFSSNEEHMEKAAALCFELGFVGEDINMGCPDKSIEKQGCGSAMIKNPELAAKIIKAAKRGAKSDEVGGIPVSVKTRLGYNRDQLEEWLPALIAVKPAAITVHARTRKEMSKVPARWERIARAVEIRDEILGKDKFKTRLIGNGDALSLQDARAKAEATGADGVMLGRAIFGNPWLFNPELTVSQVPLEERLRIMVEHSKLFTELLSFKNFSVMKKHYKAYVKDFDGAAELRTELMEQDNVEAVEAVVQKFLASTPY
ncbi:MAG TPA: tRNA-dihydrouridine synthase [Candidatus Paceibacterota bacterium]|nr:tRNA-dihydrouridine synthase [Candidatus Paceibacterota bacterium]